MEQGQYKVIVAHPSKQHSFYTATAFEKAGYLQNYITTVYDREGSLTNKLKKFLGNKDIKKASTHACEMLPNEKVVQFYEMDYLISLGLNRFPILRDLREKHRVYVANKFGRKVAKYIIKHPVDAVVMYDTTATECFKILKKKMPEVKRILDVSIASKAYMRKNFETDMEITNDRELFRQHKYLWNKKSMEFFLSEINDADAFFVPSQMVKESITFCGRDSKSIQVIPYGVDIDKFSYNEKGFDEGPLKLLFVGQFISRKGVHHLCNVINRLPKDAVELHIVGSYDEKSELVRVNKNKKNIFFHGFVTRDKIEKIYQECDAFVFPTLGEGFALVVLESLSCGLPVICSTLAGGNDAIQDGINGFTFDPFNEDELFDILCKCIADRKILIEMRKNARNSAEKYTWDLYYKNIVSSFNKIMEE